MRDRNLEKRATEAWAICTSLRRFYAEGQHDAAWAAIGVLHKMSQDGNRHIARLALSTVEAMSNALLDSEGGTLIVRQ